MATTTVGAAADTGYFPAGESLLHTVQRERFVGLFFGQRALAIGALEPLNFVGTAEHSRGRNRPFQRLARTGNAFESVFFGTKAEADRTLAIVRKMHNRVRGELPTDAGRFPAGTPYSAFDPELMLWTVAVTADSSRHFYELFVRRLTPDERDALWQDWIRFGELFGMPREVAPATAREFDEWYAGRLASDELHLTPEAHATGYATAFEIPMDRHAQPAKWVHDLIMLASLPEPVRRHYGLSFTRAHALALRPAVEAVRAARHVAPRAWTTGRNRGSFNRVAEVERRRIAAGKPTFQLDRVAAG